MASPLACASITWNDWPAYRRDQIFAEIAAAGYVGWPLAFPAFDEQGQPAQPARDIAAELAHHGLVAAPGYLSGDFWLAAARTGAVVAARQRARFSRALGLDALYVSCSCTEPLFAVSGQATGRRAIGLDDAGFDRLAATLDAMGAATRDEGVALCYHNHAGSYVETEAEYEALIARIDPALVWLGPDTGHLAIGGGDTIAFFQRHARRIRTVHLKDIDPAVLATGQRERSGYRAMVAAGLFAELGEGCIDFPALLATLRAADFDGWLVAETDKTMKPSARQSVEISRAYLQKLGL